MPPGSPATRPRTPSSDEREERTDGLPEDRPGDGACRRAPTCPRSRSACSTTGPPTRRSRRASRRARRPATDGGATSSSSTTARRSPTACRTTATCFTGYVKDVVPRYQTMRGRRVERRFGWDCHGLPAEVEAEKQLGITTQGRDPRRWASTSSTTPAATSVLRYTKDWERYVTRQARWVDFANDYKTLDLAYMESVMWAFKTLYDKGLVYEGFRVLAYCWRCETPLSNTETRMDDVYRDRQDPALTVGFQLRRPASAIAGLDDHAVDAAVQPGARRRPGHRVRGAASSDGAALRARRGPASAAYAKELAGCDAGRHGARRATWSAAATRRCSTSSSSRPGPNAFQVLGGRLRDHRGRHRGGAHGAGVRRGRPERLQRGRHPDRGDRRRAHPVHRAGARRTRGSRSSRPTSRSSRDLKERGRGACGTRPTRTRTRTAGAATPRWSTRRCRPGSSQVTDVQGPDGRAQPADHLGAGARQGRLVRQVAGQRPRLVDQPQPVLGLADPGVEVATTRRTRGSTSTARSTSWSATSASRSTDLHRPVHRRADPARTRTTRPGSRPCAGCPRCSTAGSSPGSMPFAQVHYPFENARLVRAPLPGRLHRRVHRADPRLVLHHARAGHGAVRPAGVPQLRQPRHPARRRRPEDVQEPAQLPGRLRGVRPRTAPTRCAGC